MDALNKYDLSRNTRLSTYAVHWIMKAIGEECERWRYRGMGGQTRADRFLFSHSAATAENAEELAAEAHCSLKSMEDAIARLNMKELPTKQQSPAKRKTATLMRVIASAVRRRSSCST